MSAQITIIDGKPPIRVENSVELEYALREAADEAKARGMLGAVIIEAANRNSMTIVVGCSETVLSFSYGHGDPPYYVSKGPSKEDQPAVICYLTFVHHTEFPRKCVIPLTHGIEAVKQFVGSGELPTCVRWEEV